MLSFDEIITATLTADRSPEVIRFFSYLTTFGDFAVVVGLTILSCFFFIRTRHRAYVGALFVTSMGSALSVAWLKIFFARARPQDPIALMTLDSYSFPSGHAAAAIALYGFLIYLAIGVGHTSALRRIAALILVVLIALIGVSRLYLGVHYASDVIAGYFVGLLWLAFGMWLTRHLGSMNRPH
ncbi:MAG: phosphatase PAP2 family protein [Minisyncoccia bacterium]